MLPLYIHVAVQAPAMKAVMLEQTVSLALPKGKDAMLVPKLIHLHLFILCIHNISNFNIADIILMTICGVTLVLALVIITIGYVCYKR